jgi:hypothetical protein
VTNRERLLRLFTGAPKAFWRFDIDLSLERAVDMARVCELAGIRGTFYVMLRSPFYNPFSPDGRRMVDTIIGCGQQVGLHVDHRHGDPRATVRQDQLLALTGMLEPINPRLVSFHMPPREVLWTDFLSFESAYASRWRDRYLSDARREWSPEKESRVSDAMQVNLHPEHWFGAWAA